MSARPPVVDERSRGLATGNWTPWSRAHGGQALVTLTERRSRLHLIRRVSQRTAEAVSRAIIGTLAPIKHVVHTLTADNGKEFAEHELIAIACKADFYFAVCVMAARHERERQRAGSRLPAQGHRLCDRERRAAAGDRAQGSTADREKR
ncbi:MAG: hypothetical protein R3F04_09125 [Lysobacteraceae bacterium]